MIVEFTLTDDFLEHVPLSPKDYQPAYGESAGLDLYYTGDTKLYIPPGYSEKPVLIPTGIKIFLEEGTVATIQERGSIVKTPLKVRAGIIDRGFSGEIFINCINISQNHFILEPGQKLPFQLVVLRCESNYRLISENELNELHLNSKRKDNQIGSSD